MNNKLKISAVKRFYLDENVVTVTDTSFSMIARLEACTMFCLVSQSHAWTWNPALRICNCVNVPENYHCQSYFIQPLNTLTEVFNKTIFIKTVQLSLRHDCTSIFC